MDAERRKFLVVGGGLVVTLLAGDARATGSFDDGNRRGEYRRNKRQRTTRKRRIRR